MNSSIPLANFDRSKPFYPLIMQYVILLLGMKELAVIGAIETTTHLKRNFVIEREEAFKPEVLKKFKDDLSQLLGPLNLKSASRSDLLEIPPEFVGKEFVANFQYLLEQQLLASGNMLILAHEHCKDQPAHNDDPLWEFLRHCRNAAAHGGKFHFLNGEPRRPAKWQTLTITSGMQGTNLNATADGIIPGLLQLADPIYLLWDIEQAYPTLTV